MQGQIRKENLNKIWLDAISHSTGTHDCFASCKGEIALQCLVRAFRTGCQCKQPPDVQTDEGCWPDQTPPFTSALLEHRPPLCQFLQACQDLRGSGPKGEAGGQGKPHRMRPLMSGSSGSLERAGGWRGGVEEGRGVGEAGLSISSQAKSPAYLVCMPTLAVHTQCREKVEFVTQLEKQMILTYLIHFTVTWFNYSLWHSACYLHLLVYMLSEMFIMSSLDNRSSTYMAVCWLRHVFLFKCSNRNHVTD